MKLTKIKEGSLNLYVPDPKIYRLDAKMPVFFNPIMQLNRDVSIILLRSLKRKLKCLDLHTASGVRGLRIASEVPKTTVTLNDANPIAIKLATDNAKRNKLHVEISHNGANRFLLNSKRKWDYIDLDPFGTPLPFLETSVRKLSKTGILGVSATDTSALCGTYPSACKRKYNSKSFRCPQMHELGLRILINAIQDIGEKQEIHLVPIFSHSSNHYMRVYLKRVPKSISQKGYFIYDFSSGKMRITKTQPKLKEKENYAGPLWVGNLWDKNLVKSMISLINKETGLPSKTIIDNRADSLIRKINKESNVNSVGFYDVHALAKIYQLKSLPKLEKVINRLNKLNLKSERTHITPTGIKTQAKLKDILMAISNIN